MIMILRSVIMLWLVGLFASASSAQTDTLKTTAMHSKRSFVENQFIPLGLISGGALLNIGRIKNRFQNVIPDTHTHIDDYLQHTPIVQLYIFDGLGFKHQNTVFTQTKYLIISQLSSAFMVQTLKATTRVKRPVGGNTSFPSGHTTNAFVGATVVYHEFKDTDPWLAYSGYVIATATGILRMTNDAHWLPDVLTSAGIGILTVNLVYCIKPLKRLDFPVKNKKISIIPGFDCKSFSLACTF
jgi:membrane-associated phospholipid phosphatase